MGVPSRGGADEAVGVAVKLDVTVLGHRLGRSRRALRSRGLGGRYSTTKEILPVLGVRVDL